MDTARPVLAPLSPVSRAVGEQDRAEVLTAAGRAHEAIGSLERAATAYGDHGLRTYQAECELTLCGALLRDDPAAARRVARRAARRFRAAGSDAQAVRADAIAALAEIGDGRSSLSLLRRADDWSSSSRSTSTGVRPPCSSSRPHASPSAGASSTGARERIARVRVTEDSPVAIRLLWREVRSDLARARGDRRHARHHVRAGLADLHHWQSSFGSLDLQSTLVGHGRALALQGLRLALEDSSPTLAYEWSERARALVGRVTPVRPPTDERLAAELTELRVLHAADPSPHSTDGRRLDGLRDRIREQAGTAVAAARWASPPPSRRSRPSWLRPTPA